MNLCAPHLCETTRAIGLNMIIENDFSVDFGLILIPITFLHRSFFYYSTLIFSVYFSFSLLKMLKVQIIKYLQNYHLTLFFQYLVLLNSNQHLHIIL